jgi:hypothetical protein
MRLIASVKSLLGCVRRYLGKSYCNASGQIGSLSTSMRSSPSTSAKAKCSGASHFAIPWSKLRSGNLAFGWESIPA